MRSVRHGKRSITRLFTLVAVLGILAVVWSHSAFARQKAIAIRANRPGWLGGTSQLPKEFNVSLTSRRTPEAHTPHPEVSKLLQSSTCPRTTDEALFLMNRPRDGVETHDKPLRRLEVKPRAEGTLSQKSSFVSAVISQQLIKYDRKVREKWFQEQPKGWARLLMTSATLQRILEACPSVTPECEIFSHKSRFVSKLSLVSDFVETPRDDINASSSDNAVFLYRKCCVEHSELRRVMESWLDLVGQATTTADSLRQDSGRNGGWWLSFGTLLGAVRGALFPWGESLDDQSSGVTAPSITGSGLIPWDTDVDVMIEADSLVHRRLKRLAAQVSSLSRNDDSSTAAPFVAVRPRGKKDADSPSSLSFFRLADHPDHVHGTLFGFLYPPKWAEKAALAKQSRGGLAKPDSMDAWYGNEVCDNCGRLEIWIRNGDKKTQQASDIFPLRRFEFYRASVFIPNNFVAVLQAGYGPQWCRPCKHRTSACKNVSL